MKRPKQFPDSLLRQYLDVERYFCFLYPTIGYKFVIDNVDNSLAEKALSEFTNFKQIGGVYLSTFPELSEHVYRDEQAKIVLTHQKDNNRIELMSEYKNPCEEYYIKLLSCIKEEEEKEEIKPSVNLLCYDSREKDFYLRSFEITATVDLDSHYDDNFVKTSENIINKLNATKKGIVLLHGVPGSGKSNYIRYLVTKLNKEVIYITPDMAPKLASPEILPFLINECKNSVLIIEDAENILSKRKGSDNQAVSNLLNLSDGLLSDCLGISIVATFNTELENIDEALLRPGRLLEKYCFDKLSIEKSQQLINRLYPCSHYLVTKPMSLGEIYNLKLE